ncbi:rhodanese-like domain-containing protein [Desulfotalea psychrophila]|uniref:Rhodanese domain-containing protein n=1 Tax=Desulfotalea psychrophila (strain LSv54 / DSM 12343) TaxID=177439 RepID=Q6AM23_DESPS|nr:rhodanese-like domain-containing protein [Desulfotalea psychrophila]CAG36602.1 conserved hypothetical protein [Desulfotalea psychrophila LSv54]
MENRQVDADQAQQWVHSGEAVLIDIRTMPEVMALEIAHSLYMPLSLVSAKRIEQLQLTEDKKIVFFCRSGNRSASLLEAQPNLHGGNIWSLQGGLLSWQRRGLPVATKGQQAISLERQTHITVGSLILLTAFLGATINPSFFGATAFFGAGLLFAGLSGTCMMAKMLMKLPWNRAA